MIISYVFAIAGFLFATRNIRLMLNEDRLRTYLTSQSPGKHWVAKFGEEKTLKLAKTIFLPVGTLVALTMLGVAARNIYLFHFH